MKRTQEDAEETKALIIDTALAVFCRKGYADTRLEDIAAEAGLTRGAIYHHFTGKVGLYEALLEAKTGGARELLGILEDQGSPALERLRNLMVKFLCLLEDDQEFRRVQDLTLFKTAYSTELEEGMKKKRASTAALEKAIETLIRRGSAKGEIRGKANPRAAAIAAVGLVNGVAVDWLLDPGRFSIRAMAGPIVDTFLDGLKPNQNE
jgi:TetR/AcrR family transcriptional regulator, acrAB operon repressor